jgi:hypothetical protein
VKKDKGKASSSDSRDGKDEIKKKKKAEKPKIKLEKRDTNAFLVRFPLEYGLTTDAQPIACLKCGGLFAAPMEMAPSGWNCLLCGHENEHVPDNQDMELGSVDTVNYVIGPQSKESKNDIIVFAIDVSGSMCTTTAIPTGHGLVKIGGSRKTDDEHAALTGFIDQGSSQYLPGEARGVTYISRLESAKAAVCKQIEEIREENPTTRVVIITFSNSVCIWGDGMMEKRDFGGGLIKSTEDLAKIGNEFKIDEHQSVNECGEYLADVVENLRSSGSTALGPAMVLALSIAGQREGSKVVLFTDGAANVGPGSIGGLDRDLTETFYANVGESAKEKGVPISVIAIKGSDCAMHLLRKTVSISGGTMNVIHPLEVQRTMRHIVDDPLVATGATVEIRVSPNIVLKTASAEQVEIVEDGTRMICNLGSLTKKSNLTIRFASRSHSPSSSPSSSAAAFQSILRCRRIDGSKVIRVMTRVVSVTDDRQLAQHECDASIVAVCAMQEASLLALHSDFGAAKNTLKTTELMLQDVCVTDMQQEEHSFFISNCMDLEGAIDVLSLRQSRSRPSRAMADDDVAKTLHQGLMADRQDFLSTQRKKEAVRERKKHCVKASPGPEDASSDSLQAKIDDASKESTQCAVCEERPIDIVLVPCGHMILCSHCAKIMEEKGDFRCPSCRQHVDQCVHVFKK